VASRDYYAVLGIGRDVSPAKLRSRFLELTRSKHPDRFSGAEKVSAEAEFQTLTEAFNVLSNPDKRRQHDAELARAGRPQAATTGAAAVASGNVKVLLSRGTQAYKAKQFKEAARLFEEATRADDQNAAAQHALALATFQAGDRRKAMQAIARACELDPRSGKYLKLAGKVFAQGGMTARAVQYYQESLQWLGDDPEVVEALSVLKGRG
jgi:curved DNA-binding protein CbpA